MICRGSFFGGGGVLLQAGTVTVFHELGQCGDACVEGRAVWAPRSWARPGFGVSRVVEASVLQRGGSSTWEEPVRQLQAAQSRAGSR